MMEALLHYVWKHKLYDSIKLYTVDGTGFEIIDTGIHNTQAGPDFFNAKIKIGDKIWAGNIEIHTNSSDWYKHQHDKDKSYNSVILHVVESCDKEISDESGRNIPQWIMEIPERIKQNYLSLQEKDSSIPCLSKVRDLSEIYLTDWKNALVTERLERKTNTIFQLLEDHNNDWNEVFYITLARNFGFGVNNDSFERLAKSLPLKYILKHQDSEQQVEALFFGQAGMLEDELLYDDYYSTLQREYRFLQNKYQLESLESHVFKNLRMRPNNLPHVKVAQLASLIRHSQSLFSKVLTASTIDEFNSLFNVNLGSYWSTHYQFGKESVKNSKKLGMSAIHILLINTVVPILFAYGKKKGQEIYMERAIQLLESIKSEKNFIITLFERSGMKVHHAADSQALIQLKREYCEQKKCIFCRIGHKLLSK